MLSPRPGIGLEAQKTGLGLVITDEDDVRTSNTRIAQRKRVIPHSTMKNIRRNIIML